MSRTIRGEKGPGYDYWNRRPTKGMWTFPGKFTKRWTHRKERRLGKEFCYDKVRSDD